MEQARTPSSVTYRELRRYPDDGKRRELIDGEVIEMPAPAVDHQTIVGRLYALLYGHVVAADLGFVFPAPIDVYLSPRDVPQPDLVYVSNANWGAVRKGNIHGPPDLCIEVISPGSRRRDTEIKRRLYARFRVREYWIVDPVARSVALLGLPDPLPARRGFVPYITLPASRVFQDLILDLDALFRPAGPR